MSLNNMHDYCVYGDTDSVYFSAEPLFNENMTDEEKKQFTINTAGEMESELNRFYDTFAKKAFNCNSHRLFIKGESIARTGFWVTKKRYALDKVYDLETNQDVSKMVVKGLDVVRSSFPQAFREFMKGILMDILKKTPKDDIDAKVLEFKASLASRHFLEIARNTSANNVSEYGSQKDAALNQFKKGTPVHIKAAITYNRLLKYFKIEKQFEPIRDKEKIKYVYLKDNPLQIDALAVKGYQDPPQIIEFVKGHIDTDALFDNELKNKLEDFYSALSWGPIPTEVNQNASSFFAF